MKRGVHYVRNYLKSGSVRNQTIKKNILGSFAVKGLSLIISLALVPLTVNLLDQEKYGVWITIFTIVSWFNLMDIGVGNGFRNKFAESVAIGNTDLAKNYVETLYSSILLICFTFFLLFTIVNPFLNWFQILNLPQYFDENIGLIIWMVFSLFCLQLLLKNISIIYLALQKTTYTNWLIFLGNLLALLIIVIIHQLDSVSLFSIAFAFMVSPILVYTFATFLAFRKDLQIYKPKWKIIPQKKYFNAIAGLSVKFFFIQLAAIVMYGTGNLIITQLQGPSEVTPYNVAFRLYSSAQVIFSILIMPFWSAFTEANAKGDHVWIKKSISRLILIWFLFSVGIFILLFFSSFIFSVWIGDEITIPFSLSVQFCIFTIVNSALSIFISFLSGIGKITILFYCTILQMIFYFPLTIFLADKMALGSVGVVLSINIIFVLTLIILIVQTKNIIFKKAQGIWNK